MSDDLFLNPFVMDTFFILNSEFDKGGAQKYGFLHLDFFGLFYSLNFIISGAFITLKKKDLHFILNTATKFFQYVKRKSLEVQV